MHRRASAPSRDSGSAPRAQLQLGSPRVRKGGVWVGWLAQRRRAPGPWAARRPALPGSPTRAALPALCTPGRPARASWGIGVTGLRSGGPTMASAPRVPAGWQPHLLRGSPLAQALGGCSPDRARRVPGQREAVAGGVAASRPNVSRGPHPAA